VSVQKVLLCTFQCKARRSGVSLESPGLENIPQVPRNRSENGQNHAARKAISATLLVLKWSGAIFRPRSSKVGVQNIMLYAFQCKPRPSGVSFRVPRTGKYPKSCMKSSWTWSNSRCAWGGLGYYFSLKVKWDSISVQKLQRECSKSFPLSISLKTKSIRS